MGGEGEEEDIWSLPDGHWFVYICVCMCVGISSCIAARTGRMSSHAPRRTTRVRHTPSLIAFCLSCPTPFGYRLLVCLGYICLTVCVATKLLQSSAPVLSTSLRRLPQGTLNVSRATDANAREINQVMPSFYGWLFAVMFVAR